MSTAERQAAVFAALGDPTRLSLLIALSQSGARSIASLSVGGGITRQAVTKHLRVLEGAGLVHSRRAGRETRFACDAQAIKAASAWLDTVSAQWDEALDRLKAHVEDS